MYVDGRDVPQQRWRRSAEAAGYYQQLSRGREASFVCGDVQEEDVGGLQASVFRMIILFCCVTQAWISTNLPPIRGLIQQNNIWINAHTDPEAGGAVQLDSFFLSFSKVRGNNTNTRCFLSETRQKSTKEELEDQPEISIAAVLSNPLVPEGSLVSSLPFMQQGLDPKGSNK